MSARGLLGLLAGLALIAGCAKQPPQEIPPPPTVEDAVEPPPIETEPAAETAEIADAPAEPAAETAETAEAPAESEAAAETGSQLTAEDMGVGFYEGAEVILSNVLQVTDSETKMVQLATDDSVDQVYEFYKAELGEPLLTDMLGGADDSRNGVLIKMDGDIQYSINISVEDGRTVATISRVERGGE